MELGNLHIVFLAMVAAGGAAYALVYPYLSGQARAEKRQETILKAQPARRGNDRSAELTGRKKQVSETRRKSPASESSNPTPKQ